MVNSVTGFCVGHRDAGAEMSYAERVHIHYSRNTQSGDAVVRGRSEEALDHAAADRVFPDTLCISIRKAKQGLLTEKIMNLPRNGNNAWRYWLPAWVVRVGDASYSMYLRDC